MGINKIDITSHTVFKKQEINFSKGINVLIGENGTGKTHLLKMLYDVDIDSRQYSLFENYHLSSDGYKNTVFIPAKDMLTHAKGFISMSNKYKEFPFDKTLTDIIEKAQQWKLREIPQIAQNILPILETMMEGTVVYENEEFHIKKENGTMVNFMFEAEGFKKVGLLWQLLMNENITEGTVLLWDEPDANINPKFVPELVDIMFEVSRRGVQIFISTHDYIMAKYIEVKSNDHDHILFHSLYKTDHGIQCESNRTFRDLENNAIMDIFIQLYKDEVERAMA